MGIATERPLLAAAGFAGGLLHILNHAIFKGLLFLAAGAAVQSTATRDIDRLGGLLKPMPRTGFSFLVGSIAICGLPPLNGFVSEALIYYGALRGMVDGLPWPVASAVVLASLGIIGGLACACFAKAFGVVFLGSPRSAAAEPPKEAGTWMQAPMFILSGTCLAIGLAAPVAVGLVAPVVEQITSTFAQPSSAVSGLEGIARSISVASFILLGLLLLLAGVRFLVLRGRPVRGAVTWDCGYAKPTPRMQYTASSFAQPLTHFFGGFLRTRAHGGRPEGLFPRPTAAFSSHTPDVCTEEAYAPLFQGALALFSRLKGFQHGRLQLYVLYVSVTLLGLLILKLR